MSEVKPSRAHAKASIACMILILCGLGFSAVFPFISIQCVRDGDRIESVIEKRILGLIPFNTTRIEHLAGVSLLLETGVNQGIRTVDTYYFQFDDSQGNETKVMARPYKGFAEPLRAVVADINAFLDDDGQSEFSTWYSSLLGWAGLLPVALGGTFLLCVVWNRLSSNGPKSRSRGAKQGTL